MALTATAGTAMFRCEGEFRMTGNGPRGIAVIDAGSTNTKIVLFDHTGAAVAVRKTASRHVEGPPYRHIDPEPMVAFAREILPELDRFLPIDAVVPCAHGAALACLAADGSLRGYLGSQGTATKERLLHVVEGKDARTIYWTLINNGWVTQLDHAAYLGKELAQAEFSIKYGVDFKQDGA